MIHGHRLLDLNWGQDKNTNVVTKNMDKSIDLGVYTG